MKASHTHVRLLLTGLLLAILLHYPVISFFSLEVLWFGVPALLIYLFVVWTLLIAALHWYTRGYERSKRNGEDE